MIIGITGNIGCGKSTAANYLSEKYEFIEYMFAGPLKEIAVILKFEHHQIFGTQEQKLEINKFWGISGREFLQAFGSEVCRDFLPKVLPDMKFNNMTLWARLFEKFHMDNSNSNIILSDVRFPDEADIIKSLGGKIIRIMRDDEKTDESHTTHKSETSMNNIKADFTINNDGNINDLHKKLDSVFEHLSNPNDTHVY